MPGHPKINRGLMLGPHNSLHPLSSLQEPPQTQHMQALSNTLLGSTAASYSILSTPYAGYSQMEKECSLDPVARTELILMRATVSIKLDKGLKRPWRRHLRSEASTGLFMGRHLGSRGTSSGALASTLGPNFQGRVYAVSRDVLGGKKGKTEIVCGPGGRGTHRRMHSGSFR